MQKSLFFALAAFALTFVACENKTLNEPKDPTTQDSIVTPDDLNIKDYVGTTWFLDSVCVGSRTSTHMCQPIFLLSETEIQLGNNVGSFRYEQGNLYISMDGEMETKYEIVSLDEKGTVVKAGQDPNVRTYYISALPTLDRDKQNPISEGAIMGKYKMVIGSTTETKVDGSEETYYTTGGMITWMTFKEDHKMLYEDSSPNADMEGIWELYAAEKKICFGTYSSLADMHEYGHPEDILVFNDDYLVTGSDYDYDPSMGMTHRHYESVFVRIK